MWNRFSSVFLIVMSFSFAGNAQTELEEMRDSVYQALIAFDEHTELVKLDSNTVTWYQVSMYKYYDNTPERRAYHSYDTLEISLRFETGWSETALSELKTSNSQLIVKLKERYVEYMDSIDWSGYKITRSGFQDDVVSHLKWKYPVKFTEEEKMEIDSIKRCPDFLAGSIGVFLKCDQSRIEDDRIRYEYIQRLRFISQHLFGTEKINYGNKKVYE